jgi:DNA-binding beta-propeller fold protein YncE
VKRINRIQSLSAILFFGALLFCTHAIFPQDIDLDRLKSEEQFRWGVLAYHNGFFNNAIKSFETALSIQPEDVRTMWWLARAYFKSGFEQQAVEVASELRDSGEGTALLSSWLDTISYRRSLGSLMEEDRLVVSGSIDSADRNAYPFKRPSSVKPLEDGSFYLVSFFTDEILHIDPNGSLIASLSGGLPGFNGPMDVLPVEGELLFVSEFHGNRIVKCTLTGRKLSSFGETGTGPGQLMGPHYLAQDGRGYLYVTDIGNRRVSKYDYDGNFILSFGKKEPGFSGLTEPTGITIADERIYVSDRWQKRVHVFDLSGNSLGTLADGQLSAPEGLIFGESNTLLVADGRKVLELDLSTEAVSVKADLSNEARRIVHLGIDAYGNLLLVDFDLSKLFTLSPMTSLHTGFFVQIDRILANEFPENMVEVSVTARSGEPVVGLQRENFTVTEFAASVGQVEVLWDTNAAARWNIVLLLEKSLEMSERIDSVREAVGILYDTLGGQAKIKLVSAGRDPVLEAEDGASRLLLMDAAGREGFDASWRFDLGVRMAASQLNQEMGRKLIIYLSDGGLGATPYESYSLMELGQYLKNNGVAFYSVYLNQKRLHPDIDFLSTETGGESIYYYQPEGIGTLVRAIEALVSPHYILRFTSPSDSDFGRRFLQLAVEVTLRRLSGRDESGYYGPLEF